MNGEAAKGHRDEREVLSLYKRMLEGWNRRNAGEIAALYAPDGNIIGFDGSLMEGRAEIESVLSQIFAHHQTPAFVGKPTSIRFLADGVAVIRGVAGMVPPGDSDLNPALNTVQTLVAAADNGQWHIAVFQNTPAAFHGRPELRDALTEELRQVLRGEAPHTPIGDVPPM